MYVCVGVYVSISYQLIRCSVYERLLVIVVTNINARFTLSLDIESGYQCN